VGFAASAAVGADFAVDADAHGWSRRGVMKSRTDACCMVTRWLLRSLFGGKDRDSEFGRTSVQFLAVSFNPSRCV